MVSPMASSGPVLDFPGGPGGGGDGPAGPGGQGGEVATGVAGVAEQGRADPDGGRGGQVGADVVDPDPAVGISGTSGSGARTALT